MVDEIAHRTTYRKPVTPEAIEAHGQVRMAIAEAMAVILARVPAGREQSLAMTKLEEAMFWGNAGVARLSGSEGGKEAA